VVSTQGPADDPSLPPVTDDGAGVVNSKVLSRGQKKRQTKKLQYLKREQLVLSSLRLRREQDQKSRIDGLDAVRAALLDAAAETATKPAPISVRGGSSLLRTVASRQKLMRREAAQMSLVLQHPSFQQDPFGAIQLHLKNTAAVRSSNSVDPSSTAGKDSHRGGAAGSSSSAAAAPQSSNALSKPGQTAHRVRHRRKHQRVKATRTKSR
jgi:hypothetical protein